MLSGYDTIQTCGLPVALRPAAQRGQTGSHLEHADDPCCKGLCDLFEFVLSTLTES